MPTSRPCFSRAVLEETDAAPAPLGGLVFRLVHLWSGRAVTQLSLARPSAAWRPRPRGAQWVLVCGGVVHWAPGPWIVLPRASGCRRGPVRRIWENSPARGAARRWVGQGPAPAPWS